MIFRQERSGFTAAASRCTSSAPMIQGAEELQDQVAHLNEMAGPVFKITETPG
jgi:hypothetical protein